MKLNFIILSLLPVLINCYSSQLFRFSNNYGDTNQLDPHNLEKLEKMFYERQHKYFPYKNRFNNNTSNKHNNSNTYSNNSNNNYNTYSNKNINITKFIEDITNDLKNLNEHEVNMENINDKPIITKEGRFKKMLFMQAPNPMSYNRNTDDKDEISTDSNFEIIKKSSFSFKNIGGYDKIKQELLQCSDLLINYDKYKKYNVRTPKGMIFEGPPGNGKTLIAKCFSGEINVSFIPVSGSEFSEKYVGVGAKRVRELFKLASKNKPCIIFIDEIDALARKRGNDMVSSNSEKDQTLNQLLINLDGFKNSDGIFIIGATNRIDLLDPALIRPGRIDKNIYIGNPDSKTREEIIKIHLNGKPIDELIDINYITEMTGGFSGAQIENLLNEGMLNALRENREMIKMDDLEFIANRIIAGWQATESKYSDDIINRIIIHELGHALTGFLLEDHPNLMKVTLNLWSPKTPGYTVFESNDEDGHIYTKNGLLSHLIVLLGGRIAEEIFYGYSVTTGAKKDLEQAYLLAKNMIIHYGMGKQNIYPDLSDKSKYLIDQEINKILLDAHDNATIMLKSVKDLIIDCSVILKKTNLLKPEDIINIINTKYPNLWIELNLKK